MIGPNPEKFSRQALYFRRKQRGLAPLPSPWAWLGVIGAREVAEEAFRISTWQARHQSVDDGLDRTIEEMKGDFVQLLTDRFTDLLSERALAAGIWLDCDCTKRQAAAAAIFRAEVPADWRPQYPQFPEEVKSA